MNRIDAMQAFARVVETGSFTKAAESLQASRTRVTQLVQQLEAHLRVTLLHRTTRKVNTTADGAAYYERVVRLLADLEDAEASLSGAAATPRGRLRVDVPAPIASLVLVPALPAFVARYPELQLELGVSDRAVDLIDEDVDAVIRVGTLREGFLRARHVADLALGLFAAPDYLRRAGLPAHPADLEHTPHALIGFRAMRARGPLLLAMRRGDETCRVASGGPLAVDDGHAYLAAGIAGLGVVCLPRYLAAGALARGELQPLFGDWQLDPLPLHLAYPPGRQVSRKLHAFIDWVVALLDGRAPEITRPGLAPQARQDEPGTRPARGAKAGPSGAS